jgi:hypothetical protein
VAIAHKQKYWIGVVEANYKNDGHNEEECQLVEVEKKFKNLWLLLLE